MAGDALVDAGALYAFLDVKEPWHARCKLAFAEVRLPLVTTAPVLTKLFHTVVERKKSDDGVWELLRSNQIEVSAIATPTGRWISRTRRWCTWPNGRA